MQLLSGSARLAGVIGWPVAHSRSPQLHGTWLNRYGIDGAYLPLPVAPEHFADTVRALRHAGFAGANVTIPHKEAAFAVCDRLEPSALRAGAVNTLVFGQTASPAPTPTATVSSPICAPMASIPPPARR